MLSLPRPLRPAPCPLTLCPAPVPSSLCFKGDKDEGRQMHCSIRPHPAPHPLPPLPPRPAPRTLSALFRVQLGPTWIKSRSAHLDQIKVCSTGAHDFNLPVAVVHDVSLRQNRQRGWARATFKAPHEMHARRSLQAQDEFLKTRNFWGLR